MIPFKLRAAVALISLTALTQADTVTLKTGEKIDGKILSETDTEMTLQVQVTATIKDERVVKKADIEKIDKVMPDETAWPALNAMALGTESLDPADYQRARAMLGEFIANFPQSKHAQAAKDKLAAFEAEAKRVEAGELKLGGKWLSKAEVERERVQVIGSVLLTRMKRFIASGQLVEAMNTFATLDKEAGGSAAYPDAVELTRQVLPSLKAAADQSRARLKAQADENKRRLSNAKGADLQQLERMLKQQADSTAAAVASYERSGMQWLPLSPATDRSLSAISTKASSELSKVSRVDTAKMRNSIALANSAQAALAAKNVDKAEKDLRDALSAWSNNELGKRLQPQLATAKKVALEEKAAAAKAKAEADAAAAKEAAKPKPTPTPPPVAAVEPSEEETAKKKDDGSIFSKPIFWVGLLVFGGLVFAIRKFLSKFRDPSSNILDQ